MKIDVKVIAIQAIIMVVAVQVFTMAVVVALDLIYSGLC